MIFLLVSLIIFDLFLLMSNSFEVQILGLQQRQNGPRWLWLPHFKKHLEQQKQTLDLEEELKLIEMLQNQCQVAHAHAKLLGLVSHYCTVVHQYCVQLGLVERFGLGLGFLVLL